MVKKVRKTNVITLEGCPRGARGLKGGYPDTLIPCELWEM